MVFDELYLILGAILTYTCMTSVTADDEVIPVTEEVRSPQEAEVPCECITFYLCKNETTSENGEYYGENVIDIRFGESDCEHYLDKCCPTSDQIPVDQVPTTTTEPTTDYTCGNRNSNGVGFKITGDSDNEADYGEFPWMVALLRNKVMECGGSIIHPQVVLTAAHCVKGKKNLTIRAGEWDTQTEKELYPIQERTVRETIIHESYYAGGLHNDIALLVLDSPLVLTPVVGTICLPQQGENMDDRDCVVSGWGKDAFGKEGKYQVILKKIEVPIVPRGPCQNSLRKTLLGPNYRLHESFMCAGGHIGKDACKGDGGGPLACPSMDDPHSYVQAGMVAFGIGCGSEIPAVYVNIPFFKTWIDKKIASLSLS